LIIPIEYVPAVSGAILELAQFYNWEQFGNITPDEAADAMGDMWENYVNSIAGEDINGQQVNLPIHQPLASTPGWAFASGSRWLGGYWSTGSSAQNNGVSWSFYLNKATWRLTLFGGRTTGSGIAHLYLNGVAIGTIDAYGAGDSNHIFPYVDFEVSEPGLQTLAIVMESKNAGSSGYALQVGAINIQAVAP
jgi:hypothetical protein